MQWLLSLITADNLAAVVTAFGAVCSALGIGALWHIRKEPPKPGSMDALLVAMAENTAAQKVIGGQFGANLELFKEANDAIGGVIAAINNNTDVCKDIRTENRAMREHLNALRDKR